MIFVDRACGGVLLAVRPRSPTEEQIQWTNCPKYVAGAVCTCAAAKVTQDRALMWPMNGAERDLRAPPVRSACWPAEPRNSLHTRSNSLLGRQGAPPWPLTNKIVCGTEVLVFGPFLVSVPLSQLRWGSLRQRRWLGCHGAACPHKHPKTLRNSRRARHLSQVFSEIIRT